MPRGKFSNKAKQHAAYSKADARRQVKEAARRSGPVTVSYLPGFEPPPPPPDIEPIRSRAKFPFRAIINGRETIVYPDRIEYPDGVTYDSAGHRELDSAWRDAVARDTPRER